MNRLTGIHAVREALEADRPLDSLIVARGSHGNRIEELVRLARQHGIPVRFEERIQLDRSAGTREHQGVVAFVAASPSASFEDLLKPRDAHAAPGLLVLLDGVEDPQNLGAIVRTALAAGAQSSYRNAAPPGLRIVSRGHPQGRLRIFRLRASRTYPARWRI